jgi:ribosomal protein S18 acetylase RimI-like enzyme
MISYTDSTEAIDPTMLEGFFEGWPNPPSKQTHLDILNKSYASIVAVDDSKNKVVGFVTAISDGIFSAHITFLEVLPEYRKRGIATELVKRMLAKLENLYAISLMCDKDIQSFYARFGMSPGTGMNIRNFQRQCGS